jgi:hypothetical protein
MGTCNDDTGSAYSGFFLKKREFPHQYNKLRCFTCVEVLAWLHSLPPSELEAGEARVQTALLRGKSPVNPFDERWCGIQGRSGRRGEDRKRCPYGNRSMISQTSMVIWKITVNILI